MKIHEIVLVYDFDDVFHNRKEFEIIKDNKGIQIGDRVKFIESDKKGSQQRYVLKDVKYILNNQPGLEKGYIAIGLSEVRFS